MATAPRRPRTKPTPGRDVRDGGPDHMDFTELVDAITAWRDAADHANGARSREEEARVRLVAALKRVGIVGFVL